MSSSVNDASGYTFRVAIASSDPHADALADRVAARASERLPARVYGVESIAWGGLVVSAQTDLQARRIETCALGRASEVDGVVPSLESIGVGGHGPIEVEVHRRTYWYPQPLVTAGGVRVGGFSVAVSRVGSRDPETGALAGGDLLDLLGDAVKDVVGGLDSDAEDGVSVSADDRRSDAARVDDQVGHGASPSDGEGAEPGLAGTLSVGGDQAAGGRFPDSPAADPAEPASLADEVFALRGEVFAVREMTRTVLDGIAHIAEGFRLRSRRRPPHPIDQETES